MPNGPLNCQWHAGGGCDLIDCLFDIKPTQSADKQKLRFTHRWGQRKRLNPLPLFCGDLPQSPADSPAEPAVAGLHVGEPQHAVLMAHVLHSGNGLTEVFVESVAG